MLLNHSAADAGLDIVDWVGKNPKTMEIAIDRALVRKGGLRAFMPLAWDTVQKPGSYRGNWHLDAINEHLQWVIEGQIKRLLIMCPPRHAKSMSTAVMAPAWSWIDRPHLKWLFASYAFPLAVRDSRLCRRILMSPWFQERWGDKFRITSDQNTKIRFDNDKHGYRLSTSVKAAVTGYGGSIVVCDDPHSVGEAESPAVRERTLEWWWESMQSRLDDPATGCFVVIGQRVHEQDLIGDIMRREGQDYTKLCLPAEFEPDHPQRWFRDPRKELGELLWPSHFNQKAIDKLKIALGPYAAAAQLSQRPAPRSGGFFKREWFTPVKVAPGDLDLVRGWDLAGSVKKITKSDPDWTATVQIGWSPARARWCITHAQRWREGPGDIRKIVHGLAVSDDIRYGDRMKTRLVQDPGQAGLAQIQSYLAMLGGFNVKSAPASGDKAVNAEPIAGQAQIGNVDYVLNDDWNKEFFDELASFPTGAHDDYVDALSAAFNELTGGRKGLTDFYAGEVLNRMEHDDAMRKKGAGFTQEITDDLGVAFNMQRPP
jgi:predicted phage terminase large subunit-like protein